MHANNPIDISSEWVKIRFPFLLESAQIGAHYARCRVETALREIQEAQSLNKHVYETTINQLINSASALKDFVQIVNALNAAKQRGWTEQDIIQLDAKQT